MLFQTTWNQCMQTTKSQKIRIEKLDKRKKDPEYIEPSLVFVCDQENTTAHAYEEVGEISPYYQNDKLP